MPDGLLVVDKPPGWTSHDVVARCRRLAGTRRVGHAGTLDPMATGVLVLGVGRATRLLTFLVGVDKTYAATVRLGVATVTDDAEGEVTARCGAAGVDAAVLAAACSRLVGQLQQVPSAVSAIKVGGRRAYARVRAGEDVALAARAVTVHSLDVSDVRSGDDEGVPVVDLDVLVHCSSGTYVRALARDLGSDLGVGGHLTALRRTRVGPFGLEHARTLDELADDPTPVAPADAARLAFPVRDLDADEARSLSHGRAVVASALGGGPVAGIGPDGRLVAVLGDDGASARPLVVLAPA